MKISEFHDYVKSFPIEGVYSTVECCLIDEEISFEEICNNIDDSDSKYIEQIFCILDRFKSLRHKYGNFIEIEGKSHFRSFNYYEQECLNQWDDAISNFLEILVERSSN